MDRMKKLYRGLIEGEPNPYEDYQSIYCRSPLMDDLLAKLRDLADEPRVAITLYGEQGSGKEAVAKHFHYNSVRRNRPFLAIDLANVPAFLVEINLFGHAPDFLPAASAGQEGYLDIIRGGTIYVSEIADLPTGTLERLLNGFRDGRFQRLGDETPTGCDFSLIAGTSRDLQRDFVGGRQRPDLFKRLNSHPCYVPPLRKRRADIPLLAHGLLREIMGDDRKPISAEALDKLSRHDWPGNTGQLKRVLKQAAARATGSLSIEKEHVQLPAPGEVS